MTINSTSRDMYGSPGRDRLMFKAVIHVAKTWLRDLPAEDTRRSNVISTVLHAESLLANHAVSANEATRAVTAFCASCRAIHLDLAACCSNGSKAKLAGCWLIGLLAGARPG